MPLALLAGLYAGNPSPTYLAAAIAIALATLAGDCWIVARGRWRIGVLAPATHLALAAFLGGFLASPLPAPPVFTEALPRASPPAGMDLHVMFTGANHRTAAFGYRGGRPWDRREQVMTAVLVRHPKGDLLIDSGLGRTISRQVESMPLIFWWATDMEPGTPAIDQLEAAGYDPRRLRSILLTHAHWDHVSGIPDFPWVLALVSRAEHQFIHDGGYDAETARQIDPSVFREYEFDGGAYLGFDRSHDLYGDGSIVIVPSPGHTPGSVVIFVTLPGGPRFAFVGDLIWQMEGLFEREERPWFVAQSLDHDRDALRVALLHMYAIAARYPQIAIVPSHDARGFQGIPGLSRDALR